LHPVIMADIVPGPGVVSGPGVVPGCRPAVSVSGGLTERKRAFGMLRLTGMPLRSLRRIVLLEA
jgi:hypothetical protein